MNWGQSYSASWRVYRVNRKTWADREQIYGVDNVSISRTADGGLLESGGMDLSGAFEPDYYRIVMIAEQGGEVERVDVATLLFDISGGSYNYGTDKPSAEGYSVLYPASKQVILAGEYAPQGVNGAEYAAELLRSSINAPVEVEGGFILNENIVHEIGSYIIDAVWAVLDAGGYVIQIDGRGVVHIRKKPTEPALVIDNTNARLLGPEIPHQADISELPNRYIVLVGSSKTIAVNDDPESPISTESRGYYVDYVDESPTPVNGETYGQYANRKLREKSVLEHEHSYKREYAPDVMLYSIVRASIDGLEGDLRVDSQSVECGKGITVSEKGTIEVTLWNKE